MMLLGKKYIKKYIYKIQQYSHCEVGKTRSLKCLIDKLYWDTNSQRLNDPHHSFCNQSVPQDADTFHECLSTRPGPYLGQYYKCVKDFFCFWGRDRRHTCWPWFQSGLILPTKYHTQAVLFQKRLIQATAMSASYLLRTMESCLLQF